jgi:hypothetical protein
MESIQEEKLEGPFDLGTTLRSLCRSVQNFIKSFWVNFGKEAARTMAEECRAEVVFFSTHLLLHLALLCAFWGGGRLIVVVFYRICRRWKLLLVLLEHGHRAPSLLRR